MQACEIQPLLTRQIRGTLDGVPMQMTSLNKLKVVLYFIFFFQVSLYSQEKLQNQELRVLCSDGDFGGTIHEPILNIEIYKGHELVQTIQYTYEDTFMLAKHFDLTDINFDGHDDIVILAGLTANRGQPYYAAYLWSPNENQFIHTNEITQSMPNLCIDREKKLLYSFYLMNDGRREYHVFKFEGGHYTEIGYLQEFTGIFDHPIYLYENESFEENCNFKTAHDLPDEWKRVVSFPSFSLGAS